MTLFLIVQPLLCCRALEAYSGIARGLSERSEFRSARSKLKRTETPKANTVGWAFFWYLFFGHAKKRYSPIKGETYSNNINRRLKKESCPGRAKPISLAPAQIKSIKQINKSKTTQAISGKQQTPSSPFAESAKETTEYRYRQTLPNRLRQ